MQIISTKGKKNNTVVVFHLQMDSRASIIKVRDLGELSVLTEMLCLCDEHLQGDLHLLAYTL